MKHLRQQILIVDDSEMNRALLAEMLGDEFLIMEAEDGAQAIALLQTHSTEIALILLDLTMPNVDGFEVLSTMSQRRWLEYIPVIMISAETIPSYVERAYDLGVTDYISRPFDARTVRRRVVNTIMLYTKQRHLTAMVADQVYEKEKTSSLMVEILSNIVEFRNGESGLHVLHIRVLTELLLRRLIQKTDRYHVALSSIPLICNASALHDIGKIAIPESILNKPGRLSQDEYEIMKGHCTEGAAMLDRLPLRQHEPLVRTAYEICRWHHERYDGSGYPDGLVGDNIPISAQVVSLADVYDALTSQRVYKPAYSHEQAMEMILDGQCGVFNPLLLQCLEEIAPQLPAALNEHLAEKNAQMDSIAVAEELSPYEEYAGNRHTISLLEHERLKYQFFASMSREIQFELSVVPHILTFSEWGAKQLGLSEIITAPTSNEALFQVISKEDYLQLCNLVHSTTVDFPIAEYSCPIRIAGRSQWSRIVLRSLWSADDSPEYSGAIGKLMRDCGEQSPEDKLNGITERDMLTGLLTRAQVKKSVGARLSIPQHPAYALLILNLDRFRAANELHGHLFGDNLLKYVADKLRRSIRSSDLAARVEGDEFLILMAYSDHVLPQVERVLHAFSDQQEQFPVSVSIGVALSPAGRPDDAQRLFYRARQAMRQAKNAGGGQYRFYDESENPSAGDQP